jgi:hypothetical protein
VTLSFQPNTCQPRLEEGKTRLTREDNLSFIPGRVVRLYEPASMLMPENHEGFYETDVEFDIDVDL